MGTQTLCITSTKMAGLAVGFFIVASLFAAEAFHTPVHRLEQLGTTGIDDKEGCPEIADIDVKTEGKFTGFCAWYDKGHELALMGCNGKKVCVPNGKTFAVDKKGTYMQFGSIVVLPGCTFTGYRNSDFAGPKYEITGPAVIPKANFHDGINTGNVYGAYV